MRRTSFAVALLTCLVSLSVTAQQTSFTVGDWSVDKSLDGVQIAKVTTGSGKSTVGILCFISSQNCIAYLYSGNSCDVGAKIPMMINSSVGAFHITTECKAMPGSTTEFVNVIDDFGNAKQAFESGGEVGFVLPLRSGEFRAIRFSTSGATAAIKNVMTLPSNVAPVKRKDDRIL